MAEKPSWTTAFGKASPNLESQDTLLANKISDRERKRIDRQEELDDATHEAKIAEAKKKTVTSEAAVEKTGEKKDDSGTGVKFTGNINYPELMQKQIDERDALRQEAETAAANQQQISNDLREKLHASEMQVLKTGFDAQMQMLGKMIDSNAAKGGIVEQLAAAREMAKELGFVQGQTGGGEALVQVELKKLDFEHTLALRKMAKDDKAEERRWQLELRRLDDERDVKKEELALSRERTDMLAKAPQMIGTALARGVMASEGVPEVSDPPAPRGKMPPVTADVGESGEFECVQCHKPVAIGPTSKTAVCATDGCGAKYPINRVQSERPVEAEEEE